MNESRVGKKRRKKKPLCPADRFFEIQSALRQTIEAGIQDNLLELALRGQPQAPFYMVGRLDGQSVVLRAEKGKLKLSVSRQQYYQWEQRALQPLLQALEDQPKGRPKGPTDPEKQALRDANSASSSTRAGRINSLRRGNPEKLRLVNFWTTWCPPCLTDFHELVTINRMYRHRDFELITASLILAFEGRRGSRPYVNRTSPNRGGVGPYAPWAGNTVAR